MADWKEKSMYFEFLESKMWAKVVSLHLLLTTRSVVDNFGLVAAALGTSDIISNLLGSNETQTLQITQQTHWITNIYGFN